MLQLSIIYISFLEMITDSKNIMQSALNLCPAERLSIIETLSQSLREPNADMEKLWKEEVEQRYSAYLNGKIKTIPYKGI